MHRRDFLRRSFGTALAGAASAPFLSPLASASLWAQQVAASSSYKAVVVVTMCGGNDGNNMMVPLAAAEYNQYASLRANISLPQSSCLPVTDSTSGKTYGFHPNLANLATAFAQGRALAVANVGQMQHPYSKVQLLANRDLIPSGVGNHLIGRAQWESAQISDQPDTGWGGRIADVLTGQSGALPPILNAGPASIFTVGRTTQGITVQNGSPSTVTLPDSLNAAAIQLAQANIASQNLLVSQLAQLHAAAGTQQVLINQARSAGATLRTQFPNTSFGAALQSIAQLLAGRSAIGASRQLFYCAQGLYDTHGDQLALHAQYLSEFDGGIGAFLNALDEMGLSNQVLICTHSDFGRTLQSNTAGGSDHGWGNVQFILGGGIRGGRIIGSIPEPELGGANDLDSQGIWIPDLSVTQMTSSIASWLGLSARQVASVFPDLVNFSSGSISLS